MKKLFLLSFVVLLSGCSIFAELALQDALENRNNSTIKSDLRCYSLRASCQAPDYYSEWYTPDGGLMCQCEYYQEWQ